jgi:hypothetical protein
VCVFSQPMTQKECQITMQPDTIGGWGLAAKLGENHYYDALASNRYYYWGLAAKKTALYHCSKPLDLLKTNH